MKMVTKFSLGNPVAIVLLVLLVAAGGLYSATKFNQEQQPEVMFPGIMVMTAYPGAAPGEVLGQVTEPLEQAARGVEGVKSVASDSSNGMSVLQLEFGYGDDMKKKREAVAEAVNGATLPEGAAKPDVQFFSTTNQPIMYTAATAGDGMTEEQLTAFVKGSLLPDLKAIEGVSDVQTVGLKDDGAYIRLDAKKMAERGIGYGQVEAALRANNLSVPLGETTIGQRTLPVFVQGDLRSLEQLENWSLTEDGSVKLADIAEVERGKALSVVNRTNGQASVALNIVKAGDANTVKVADEVRKVYDEAARDKGLSTLIMYDRSTDVKESVGSLAREGALGALFASLLILFFLRNFRATLIAIVSIPLSLLIALICLKAFTDVTLNIMTLGGLAVATGRVVDDSIVVIENLVRRLRGEKLSKELVLEATGEVGRAIVSSTITTVAVFAPLGFVQGMVGGYFRPFAWTVAFALLSSLLVALTVVPLMTWALMRGRKPKPERESAVSRGYKAVLRWSLGHKPIVLLLAFGLFAGSLVPIFAGAVGVTLLPQGDYKYVFADLTMPKGTDIRTVRAEAEKLDGTIRGNADVENTNVTSGGSFVGGGAPNTASWFIGLDPKTDIDAFIDGVGKAIELPEGAEFSLVKDGGGGGGVSISVTGGSGAAIREATERITEAVSGVKGTQDAANNLNDGTMGIAIAVRQGDASRHGLSAMQASALLRPYLSEAPAGKILDGSETRDLYLALSGASLGSADAIGALPLTAPDGRTIRVSDIADVKQVQLPSAIKQKNGAEYATVTATIADKNTSKVNAELKKALEHLDLPDGTSYSLGGSDEDIQQMLSDMLMAMLVAVGMVYVIMVIAFREGRAPLAVLFSLPFALIGGLTGVLLSGEPLSVSSMIGFLMLIGIVVTNAIVLLERVHQMTERGLGIREALVEAGGTRLRPILMTAIATICALLPLAIGMGGGSIISSGLAVVVIGGLASSTLLTLIVVPVMYELLYFRRSARERRAAAAQGAEAAA